MLFVFAVDMRDKSELLFGSFHFSYPSQWVEKCSSFVRFKMHVMLKNLVSLCCNTHSEGSTYIVHPTTPAYSFLSHQKCCREWSVRIKTIENQMLWKRERPTQPCEQTPKERSNALDLPTRFHLSHLILFFSLSYSIARMFLLFIDLVRILVSIPHYTVRLHNFFFLSVAYSHKFSSRFSDCQILYPILTAINDKRYDAAIKPSRLHITVAIKTMILSTTSIFRAILIVSAFFDTQTYTALGYPVSVYVCSECCVQYGVGTDYSAWTRPNTCYL